MIDLCLSLFPWASYQQQKGAVKLHTVLDLRGNIPSVILITHGKIPDVYLLDQLIFEAGAFYVMDRGYLDFRRLHNITLSSAFFVTGARSDFAFNRLYSLEVDKSSRTSHTRQDAERSVLFNHVLTDKRPHEQAPRMNTHIVVKRGTDPSGSSWTPA